MFYDFSQKKPALFLAPMADVTNPAFRFVAHQRGADFTYTEMIHSDGFNHGDPYAKNRGFSIDEIPYGIQIVGNSAESISKAAAGLENLFKPAAKVIDINMGCPSPPITKTGCGAALMARDFSAANHPASIVRSVCDAAMFPVTAKIRIYKDDEKTLRLAKSIENAGAAAITVHGRTRDQMYSGVANWEIAAKIKKELSIPVILNGDIVDEKSLQTAMDLTNCDGYMIGRGTIGNPFLFQKLNSYLKNGELETISMPDEFEARVSDLNQYLILLKRYDLLPHVNVRAHSQWFTKGLPYSRAMRLKINDLHNDVKIRSFSDEELTVEREALGFEILNIFNEYADKCRKEYCEQV
ncbi:tRNA-dihydrouridine synthase B [Methanimicrococcus hongohii]|uniref:tRNA-dihydrouridine synthase B n=1 Tax=Methanimicrococcus hongohii TaxID=3028295 RepID=A0AA96V177_9EURY|nr:tRNA-dihydrouridine synthase family protein [Methanimicrococcus sp. Hf6]WNY23953.1 tRNA-dihydrouridine synthase B [Methanimicrococcus sp. Hf6]